MCSMVTQKHQYKFNKKEFNKNGKKTHSNNNKNNNNKIEIFP